MLVKSEDILFLADEGTGGAHFEAAVEMYDMLLPRSQTRNPASAIATETTNRIRVTVSFFSWS